MIPIERHQRILALVEQRGAVSINELTEILGVSHMTIRRDVSKLEEQGLLVSVSGGVRAVSRLAAEPSHLVKSTLQSEEKQAIGALAASHIAKKQLHLSGCRDYHPGAGAGDPRPERSPGGHQ